MKAIEKRRQQREELIERARVYAAALDDSLAVRAVVVFGSVARGDFNVWSDIDVLVIAKNLPERLFDRFSAVLHGKFPGISPVAWTPEELQLQRRKRNAIAAEADERGVVVRGELP